MPTGIFGPLYAARKVIILLVLSRFVFSPLPEPKAAVFCVYVKTGHV